MLLSPVLACAADEASPSTTAMTSTTAPDPPTTTTAITGTASCTEALIDDRRHLLCTASDQPGQRLLVALHGRGSSVAEMRAMTGLDAAAAAHGLAVVYPESTDGGWGDDTFVTPSRPAGDEDVVALDRLIAALRTDPRVAGGPVVIVGFSNGASMALRYAAQRPHDVLAVVSVAGQLPRDPLVRPVERVPLLEIYGTADPLRPYETGIADPAGRQPGAPTPTLPTIETVQAFVDVAAGTATRGAPVDTDPDAGDGTFVRTERWTDDEGTLAVLRTVVGGGHRWPSALVEPANGTDFGPTSRDVDATAETVGFALEVAALD